MKSVAEVAGITLFLCSAICLIQVFAPQAEADGYLIGMSDGLKGPKHLMSLKDHSGIAIQSPFESDCGNAWIFMPKGRPFTEQNGYELSSRIPLGVHVPHCGDQRMIDFFREADAKTARY